MIGNSTLRIVYRECYRVAAFVKRQSYLRMVRAGQFKDPSITGINIKHGDMKQFFLNRGDVHQFQDPSSVMNFIDVDQSKGNYITDSDGNHMLDLCTTEFLPLGHNHEAFVS